MTMRVDGPAVLPLRWGDHEARFTLLHFDVDGDRWAAVHTGDITSGEPVPLRIESACLFGHVLRSAQCDCGYQLDTAMQQFCRTGRGLLIYGIDQDARGLGTAAHFAIYQLRQQEGLDTDEVYRRLRAPVDARSYEPVADILRYLDVGAVRLLSNNPRRETFLRERGFAVTTEALEAPLDVHNMSTLMLEKEDLGYRWSFETHADWLEPLQASVDGVPERSRAQLVQPGRGVPHGLLAEADDDGDWALADTLAAAVPAELPDGPLVVYLTDLPRVDELDTYVRLGAAVLVVPFARIPEPLLAAAGSRVKIVDWQRRNAYRHDRPQWTPVRLPDGRHAYRRGDRMRLVVDHSTSRDAALDGLVAWHRGPVGWVEYPASSHDAVLAALAARPTGSTQAVSRADGLALQPDVLAVDTADCAPPDMARFATMNPFHFDPTWRIPVPGTDRYASSMESVWQGLKLVNGQPDLDMFDRPPTKRPPDDARGPDYDYAGTVFRYGESVVDLVTARLLIYLPAYLYVLDRLVPGAVIEEIASARATGRDVVFFDWDDNVDLHDPRSSFSHSAILASWFGGRLEEEFLRAHRDLAGSDGGLELGRYHRLHGSGEG